MDYSLILNNISKHIRLSAEEQAHFVALLEPKTYKTRKLLLKEGAICRHSIFVIKGCLRGFTTDSNGFEHVLSFALPDWWIADMYSLISQKPGALNIETLENIEVFLLSKLNQELLFLNNPKFS